MIETICFIGPRLVKLICKCSNESEQGILASNKYFTFSLSLFEASFAFVKQLFYVPFPNLSFIALLV